jgi:YQGE family putative transporter
MSIASGFPNGIFDLTWSLLAFEFFKRELEVGVFNGFLGMVGVLAAYLGGRLAKPERRMMTAAVGTALLIVGAILFGINFALPTLFLLGVLAATGDLFVWTVEYPVLMKEMEKGYLPKSRRYSYWVDRAIFVNLGRILGMIIFISLTSFFAFDTVFRSMFFAIAPSSIILLFAIKRLIRVDQ